MNYSKSQEFQFLAYMVTHTNSTDLLDYFASNIDHIKEFIQNSLAVTVLKTIGQYVEEYKDTPDKVTYDTYKTQNKYYLEVFTRLDSNLQNDLLLMEDGLFKPPSNTKFIEKHMLNFVGRLEFSKLLSKMVDKYEKDNEEPIDHDLYAKLLKTSSDRLNQFQALISSEVDYVQLSEDNTDMVEFRDIGLIKTMFRNIFLYPGKPFELLAGEKMFKSGIAQNAAISLASAGYDVLMLDLENGKKLMLRRYYQALAGLTKHEILANKRVKHEDMKSYKHFSMIDTYNKEDIVYTINPIEEVYEEDGEEKIDYDVAVWFFRAIEDNIRGIQPMVTDEWESYWNPVTDTIEIPFGDPKEYLEKCKKETFKKGGDIGIGYVKNATTASIRKEIERAINNPTKFFTNPKKRALLIDWKILLRPTIKVNNVWERMSNIDSEMSLILSEFNLPCLTINGVPNSGLLQEWDIDLTKIYTKYGREQGYNVFANSVLAGTPEEQRYGFRRLYIKENRDGAKMDHTIEIIWIDYNTFTAYTGEKYKEMHKAIFPDFWNTKSNKEEPSESDKILGNMHKSEREKNKKIFNSLIDIRYNGE